LLSEPTHTAAMTAAVPPLSLFEVFRASTESELAPVLQNPRLVHGLTIHPGRFFMRHSPFLRSRVRLAGLTCLFLIGLSGISVTPTEAQTPATISQGTKSLSFGIDGDGSAEAGIWLFISDRSNLGLLGTLDWVSEDRSSPRPDRTQFTLGIGPRIKWYVTGAPRVAPFWFGGLAITHTRRTEEGEDDRTSRGVGLEGGFGVDWFPVDQMSVGGWTGVRLGSERAENDDRTTRLRSFTTGLRVHIYFP